MARSGRPSPEKPPRSAPSGRGWPAVVLGSGRAPGLGETAERLSRPARRRAAGVRRSDSMRDVLVAHAGQRDVRYRLRDATESTTSGKLCVWWISGAPAPDFSHRERLLLVAAGAFRFW